MMCDAQKHKTVCFGSAKISASIIFTFYKHFLNRPAIDKTV